MLSNPVMIVITILVINIVYVASPLTVGTSKARKRCHISPHLAPRPVSVPHFLMPNGAHLHWLTLLCGD